MGHILPKSSSYTHLIFYYPNLITLINLIITVLSPYYPNLIIG